MADPRYFNRLGPLTLEEIAALSGAAIADSASASVKVNGVAPVGEARPGCLSYAEAKVAIPASLDGVVLIAPAARIAEAQAAGAVVLEHSAPRSGFARAAAHLFELRQIAAGPAIHPDAVIAAEAVIAPNVVIGAGAQIDSGAYIGAGSVIGPGCHIGRGSRIGSNVTIVCSVIGSDCNILSGCVIGESGFGVAVSPEGVVDVPHLGEVVIGDRVTIGAGTAIDRGVFGPTRIGDDTKIDNLCQIAHNCQIGRGVLMAAFAGVSGSTKIGDGVMFGGRVGVADQLTIGDGARLAANAAAMGDLPGGQTYSGAPAQPIRQHMREIAELRRLVRNKDKSKRGG